jgi:hypothetical protein
MENLGLNGAPWWQLGARTRRGVLVVHIVSAGTWIGIDVVMGVLVFTALFAAKEGTRALCYRALELFAVWPLIVTGLVCLASGVVLGLGTNYGLVRYWWVAIKLALNVVLIVLVVFALRPGVIEMAEQGWRFIAGEPASLAVGGLIFPPIVSTSALLVATVLAVSSRGAESVSGSRQSQTHDERRQPGDPRPHEVSMTTYLG